ncbi:MAG: DUF6544 family protein [Balneolaceae bacterium]|nr:DUF6544 family protein [Balneolaceae bacterium]
MRLAFILLLVVHGLIHLLGFLKAFQVAEIEQLTLPISKTTGVVWLLTSLLFLLTAFLFYTRIPWWWIIGTAALIISQILIITYWFDAKFGTIANAVVVIACVAGYGHWNFQNMVRDELNALRSGVSRSDIERSIRSQGSVPEIVQQWMDRSGIVHHDPIFTTSFQQTGRMKTNPDGRWMPVEAKQYVRLQEPAFLWIADVRAAPLVHLTGRDKYLNGSGHMLIKLLSLVPVADSRGPKIDQGTLLRYLAEMVWYPEAALHHYIEWEQLDARSARATMRYRGISASGLFEFNDNGDPVRFEAERYYTRPDGATLETWVVHIDENSYRLFNGIRVPTRARVSWKLEEGDFTWYELEISNLVFNGYPEL